MQITKQEEHVLALHSRRRIYETIKTSPGCNCREIQRRSNIPFGTLIYHLNYLKKQGIVTQIREKNTLCYFPSDFSIKDQQLMAILRQKSMRDILLTIIDKSTTINTIARNVNLSASTVSWHLSTLEKSGIIISATIAGRTHYTIPKKENIHKLLIIYKESFIDILVDRMVEMWDMRR